MAHHNCIFVELIQQAPRFDSGGVFSQDPALSYVRSEKSMNSDQRRAVHKVNLLFLFLLFLADKSTTLFVFYYFWCSWQFSGTFSL